MKNPKNNQTSKGKPIAAAKAESEKATHHAKEVIRETGPSAKASGRRIPDAGK